MAHQETSPRIYRSLTLSVGDPDISRGHALRLGALLVLAGMVALLLPQFTGLTVQFLIGLLMTVTGGLSLLDGLRSRDHRTVWRLFSSILVLAGGVVLLLFPVTGAITLALATAVLFLTSGAANVAQAGAMKGLPGWRWVLASGIAALVLGLLIVMVTPQAAEAVIGLLIGVQMLVNGAWLLVLASVDRIAGNRED